MAAVASLAASMGQLTLARRPVVQRAQQQRQPFVANGSRVAMKGRNSFQVEVVVGEDEPQDNAMKRFRREVIYAGVIPEVRRRRYFENNADAKKRKTKESRIKAKRERNRPFAVKSFGQAVGVEPTPFSDLFGSPDDLALLSDVLAG
eukprot:scaffold8.g1576.t1